VSDLYEKNHKADTSIRLPKHYYSLIAFKKRQILLFAF